MRGTELEKLKDAPAPPASVEARSAAIEAALAAFDEHFKAETETPTDTTQGKAGPARLIHASSKTRRRFSMRALPAPYAMAASVAALMIAAPAAFYILNKDGNLPLPTLDKLGRGLTSANSPVGGEQRADSDENMRETAEARKQADYKIALEIVERTKREEAAAQAQAPAEKPIAPVVVQANEPAKPEPRPTDGMRADRPRAKLKVESGAPSRSAESSGVVAALAPPPPPVPGMSLAGRLAAGNPYTAPTARPARPDASIAASDQNVRKGDADATPPPSTEEFRDQFEAPPPNPVKRVAEEPVSTFSIDVDTASYGFARRALNEGQLPPKDAIRIEEMVNYFHYSYPAPESASVPFQPTVSVFPAPWNADNRIVHVAIKGYEVKSAERPRANLVFLIDTSGSMGPSDRLPLVKNAFRMLVDQLKPDDTIGIVTYASGSGIALEPTKVSDKAKILAAIDKLTAGGSTAGASGIEDAYRLAEAGFDKAGVNRIILATDGDFNVGITDRDALKGFVERKRESGVFLSILGVGRGNYNDSLMQTLAQNGNGTAAYIDTLNEARKVLIDEASSTLFTIARDVKIQLEFNPARVSEYRLIGYETRALRREDFSNDKVDAGDVGSGHAVTALYEVTPVGAPTLVEDLRYGKQPAVKQASAAADKESGATNEIGFLKLRYKLPGEEASKLTTLALSPSLEKGSVADTPADVRFSTAVAAFGQLLQGMPYTKSYTYDDVLALAGPAKGDDPFGYRTEFLNLVRLAKSAQP